MDGGILVSEIEGYEIINDDPREYHKVISGTEAKYCYKTMTAGQPGFVSRIKGLQLQLQSGSQHC